MATARDYLLLALKEAQSYRGFCAPNPAVGAVIVKDNEIIAQAAHQAAGLPHAEIEALKAIGNQARGATLYVTLEPCNHQGKTPPCTEAIIQQGLAAVYYAFADPNPQVKGNGACRLKEAGIHVKHLALPEIDEFYQSYVYWLKTQRPYVTAKLALSLDGKIAGVNGKPFAITGSEAQRYTHQKRCQSDALLTSVKTVIQDNPSFNVRLGEKTIAKTLYMIDRSAQLPLDSLLLNTVANITLFHDKNAKIENLEKLATAGVKCIELDTYARGLDELAMVQAIARDGAHDLWLEAGGKIFESFYERRLINRILFYVAPKVLGDKAYPAFQTMWDFTNNAKSLRWFSLGQDAVCEIEQA